MVDSADQDQPTSCITQSVQATLSPISEMLQKSIILESNTYIEKLNIYIIVILNHVT